MNRIRSNREGSAKGVIILIHKQAELSCQKLCLLCVYSELHNNMLLETHSGYFHIPQNEMSIQTVLLVTRY